MYEDQGSAALVHDAPQETSMMNLSHFYTGHFSRSQKGHAADRQQDPSENVSNAVNDTEQPELVGYRWRKGRQLGHGAFGSVWEATSANGEIPYPVSIKLEMAHAKKKELDKEAAILLEMQGDGIPTFYQYMDNHGMPDTHRYLAMEKLGIDLEHYREKCGGTLPEAIIFRLAKQMIGLFKRLHEKKFLYRDTKPNNFMLGWDPEGQHFTDKLFLIDFGLCGTYWDNTWKPDGVHLPKIGPNGKKAGFAGTQRYASINAFHRYQQSRADDMETLAYVWGHLYTGALPWAGMKTPRRPGLTASKAKLEMFERQIRKRQEAKDNDWTYTVRQDGEAVTRDIFPPVIKDYMAEVMRLSHESEPEYEAYQDMIDRAAQKAGIDMNPEDGHFVKEVEFEDPETHEVTKTFELKCEA